MISVTCLTEYSAGNTGKKHVSLRCFRVYSLNRTITALHLIWELSTAISGGVSDPRNSTMLKMFNFIDIGERAGSGIPKDIWYEMGMEYLTK